MAYKVTFRDKSAIYMDSHDGAKLKDMLLDGSVPTNVEINGDLHRSSEIVSIIQSADPLEEFRVDKQRQLQAGRRCRGQYSIQWEISKRIRRTHGKNWKDFMSNKEVREAIRQDLLATGEKFCDSKTSSCYCEQQYLSQTSRTSEVFNPSNMFPASQTRYK